MSGIEIVGYVMLAISTVLLVGGLFELVREAIGYKRMCDEEVKFQRRLMAKINQRAKLKLKYIQEQQKRARRKHT